MGCYIFKKCDFHEATHAETAALHCCMLSAAALHAVHLPRRRVSTDARQIRIGCNLSSITACLQLLMQLLMQLLNGQAAITDRGAF